MRLTAAIVDSRFAKTSHRTPETSVWFLLIPATTGGSSRDPTTKRRPCVEIVPREAVASAQAAVQVALPCPSITRLYRYRSAAALKAGMLDHVLREFDVDPIPVHLIHPARGRRSQNNASVSGIHSEKMKRLRSASSEPQCRIAGGQASALRDSDFPFTHFFRRVEGGFSFLGSYSFAWNNAISSSPKPRLIFGFEEKRYDSL